MVLLTPTGTSIHSFQFLLKYPKIKSKEPSAFCCQPSYTGAMFKPFVGCCARGRAAASVTTHRMAIVQNHSVRPLIAAGLRVRCPLAVQVSREFWRTCIVDNRERSGLQPD